jgi:hypothetical protein
VNALVPDVLSATTMVARDCQTLTHALFSETNRTVAVRFGFFLVQIIAMLTMAVAMTLSAGR